MLSMRDTKRTSLILHGHFYQPPRENPFTGVIPRQSSASPFEDWNERIYHDCYGANAHSRYLSSDGRIISITNNFSYISFNFGPTLLSWLEEKHPDLIDCLVEADKASIGRLGHGNAIAQGFNHTILPLDSPDDARRQIEWGCMDFERRFSRKPEGIWLPECGINSTVIQLLHDYGIRFVILSPWQCNAVEEDGRRVALNGKPAPYWKSYLLQGSNGGEISAFFYHPGLAESISFGHMLRSADNLYSSLLSIKERDGKDLIHTATDGEIYGHHEPYGDMALAALIRKVGERDDFQFDNYGSYLEKHPSTEYAELHKGEDGKGTSWSCSHGVSRWYKDCGCHTGGEDSWNQKWRTPLRNALTHLGEQLDSIFRERVNAIFGSALSDRELLTKAGDVFIGRTSMNDFIRDLHSRYVFSSDHDTEIAHLLSGMKNRHFSFTSCGFFFSDISGIEPRQNIKYAIYAIKMFQGYCDHDLMKPFLTDLRDAKSNIKSQGNGMTIAQEEMKGLPGEAEAALYFFLNRMLARKEDYSDTYGRFTLRRIEIDESENFLADIQDNVNLDLYMISVLASSSIDNGINLYYCQNDASNRPINRLRITNADIPERMLNTAYSWIDRSMNSITYSQIDKMAMNMRHYSMLVKNSRFLPMETQMIENLGMTIKIIKSIFTESDYTPNEKKEVLGNMIEFVRKCGRESEIAAVNTILSTHSSSIARKIMKSGLDGKLADDIIGLLALARTYSFEPETKELQNAVYPYYLGRQADADPALVREVLSALNFK